MGRGVALIAKLKIIIERGGYKLHWTNGPRGSKQCYVDVYDEYELRAERAYPRMGSLAATAAIMSEQVILEMP